jgi:hypothetical protein
MDLDDKSLAIFTEGEGNLMEVEKRRGRIIRRLPFHKLAEHFEPVPEHVRN